MEKKPKFSKPTRAQIKARMKERRPRYDNFGRIIDYGCPIYNKCLDDAAKRNLAYVPCGECSMCSVENIKKSICT